MRIDAALGLLSAAVVVSALATAASLDQSIKRLPARDRIGVVAYSRRSLAAAVGTPRRWYRALFVVWAALVLLAAIAGWGAEPSEGRALALATMVFGVAAHTLVTALYAAPIRLAQRRAAGDEAVLARLLDRFARWQALRAAIDVATLAAGVAVLVATIAAG